MKEILCSPDKWDISNKIQLWQTLGLWITGVIGTWFVWQQNRILHRQNQIIENQRPLNDILMQREIERENREKAMDILTLVDEGIFQSDNDVDAAIQKIADLGLKIQHTQALYAAGNKSYGIETFNDRMNRGRKRFEIYEMTRNSQNAKHKITIGCKKDGCTYREQMEIDILRDREPREVRAMLKLVNEDVDLLLNNEQANYLKGTSCPVCREPFSKIE